MVVRTPRHRIPVGLSWARLSSTRPPTIPIPVLTGSRAAGLRYERRIGRMLPPGSLLGPWIEFTDLAGHGWCQPDFVLRNVTVGRRTFTVVIEAKLSHTIVGHLQAEELYTPVMELLWGQPVINLVVSRHIARDTPPAWITDSLEAALARCAQGLRTVWHVLA